MSKILYVTGMTAALAVGMIYLTSQSAARKSSEANRSETMSIDELHKRIDVKTLPVERFDAY
jgi:hypothetical protein